VKTLATQNFSVAEPVLYMPPMSTVDDGTIIH